MASDIKQQTTYKKRVISESDEDSSSSAEEDDVPLARGGAPTAEATGQSANDRTNGSSSSSAAIAPAMSKKKSDEGNHNPQDVAAGSTLLKAAAGNAAPSQEIHVEDSNLRHEIAATGFPVDVTTASSATGAVASSGHTGNGNGVANNGKMHVDHDESSDDDQPLAAKPSNGQNGTTNARSTSALPSFKKPGSSVKAKQEESSSDDNKPLSLNFDKKKAKKPSSKRKSSLPDKSTNGTTHDEESSDDDVPLAKQSNGSAGKNGNGMAVDESSDDDAPLAGKIQKPKQKSEKKEKKEKKKAKRSKGDDEDDDFEDDEKPKKKKAKTKAETPDAAATKAKSKAPKVKKEEVASPIKKFKQQIKEEDDDSQGGAGSQQGDFDEDDDEYKWWKAKEEEQDGGEEGPKWTTLQHAGVLFPPEYEPLPAGIKLKYDGRPLDLPTEAEEVAGFFAALLETDHAKDPQFRKNFYNDFLDVLSEHPPRNKVKFDPNWETGIERLDFRDMWQHFETEKEKRKSMTKEEKKRIKEEKDKLEEPYKTCLVDGRSEIVGNFRLEPPGLFRGRGEHPKKGKLKHRLNANQITINIGRDADIPKPPPGQKWKEVVHKNDVTWLANWQENVNGNFKYVFLAAGSSWKGQSDFRKYEKARELKKLIGKIRLDYEADLTSKVMADRQRATAVYFIDRFALRVGNEKGEDEADTVGCCSLRFEHITLAEPNLVTFDFLGKDSIRFYQPDKEVAPQVFKNLKLFKKGGKEGDAIFDRIKPDILNKFFGTYMTGLSAKVFRTYNASFLLQQQLLNTPSDMSVADKLLHYNRANRLVAEMCNHQRAASKTHGQAMEKLSDKLKALKYQRMKLRYTLWTIEPENKKKHKKYKDMESDLDDDWMEKHEEELVEKEKVKIRKKWEKDNEKRKADGEKELTEKELNDLLEVADDFGQEIAEERKTKHVDPKRAQTTAKILDALVKIDERIDAQKLQALDREEGKEISLTTSRINYMDPRVTVAWCKKYGVPVEKLYSKTLRTKFVWAMEVDEDWEF